MRNAATVLNPWTTHHAYKRLTIRVLLPNTSTHIVKWICIAPKKKVCTQTPSKIFCARKPPKKGLVRPWKIIKKEKKKEGCNVLNQILYPNVNSQWWFPTKKKETKSSTESWNEQWSPITFVDTIQTSLWKKRNDLEKLQIDVPQKINNFAWQLKEIRTT